MNVLIAGDFCPHSRVKELCEDGKHAEVLGDVSKIVERADFSIVNFECPVTQGGERPIEKKGPNLQCSEKGIEAIRWAGFNCVTLANNHVLDFGEKGVSNTLETCRKYGLDTVGCGMNKEEASETLYHKIGGKTLAVINCCEHEFSIATTTTAGANPLNPVHQYYAINEAKANADHVLVIVHGGHEHWQLPSTRMQETYRFFIDAGADAVVNHHQHCFSGYEIYNERPIFYGLGNFCFDMPKRNGGIWNEGYMVQLHFDDSISFLIHPYLQCQEEPRVQLLEPASFDQRLEELNIIIGDQELLCKHQEQYYQQSSHYLRMFEPFFHRFFQAMRERRWMPSFISKERRLMAADYIMCEAQRDKLLYQLNQ